jgi:hypothetical protein
MTTLQRRIGTSPETSPEFRNAVTTRNQKQAAALRYTSIKKHCHDCKEDSRPENVAPNVLRTTGRLSLIEYALDGLSSGEVRFWTTLLSVLQEHIYGRQTFNKQCSTTVTPINVGKYGCQRICISTGSNHVRRNTELAT